MITEFGDFGRGNIRGDLYQRRPRPPVAHRLERPPYRVRRHLRRRQLFTRLGDRGIALRRVEVGLHLVDRPRIAAGQNDDRRGVAECLRHAAVGVLGTGAGLHAEDADLVARTQAADGVRHVQTDALLAHDDCADVQFGGRFDEMVHRIGEKDLRALLFQAVGDNVNDLHAVVSLNVGSNGRSEERGTRGEQPLTPKPWPLSPNLVAAFDSDRILQRFAIQKTPQIVAQNTPDIGRGLDR